MTIQQLFKATETIRKHANEREFPAQVQAIFLAIASSTGQDIRQGDIADITGMSPSSISRNVSWLGPRNTLKRRDGLRWVEIYEDPKDYKRKRVRLTALGRRIAAEALA
jgi:DNA-binding MarR family transcriptional regulator